MTYPKFIELLEHKSWNCAELEQRLQNNQNEMENRDKKMALKISQKNTWNTEMNYKEKNWNIPKNIQWIWWCQNKAENSKMLNIIMY